MKRPILAFLFIVVALPHLCAAMERFDLVTTEELVQMLAARERGEREFLLVNTLDEILYRNKSIPGSISVPWSRVTTLHPRLGEDKNRLIVTYCMGYR